MPPSVHAPRAEAAQGLRVEQAGPLADVDTAAVFEVAPDPMLLLTPDLRIVAGNRAYREATGLRRDAYGRHLFDVFPDNPDLPDPDGVANLRASLQRVLDHGRPDVMPVQRYDVPSPHGDGFVERSWSPVNVPVLGPGGQVRWLLHRVMDVTALLGLDGGERVLRERMVEVEAELLTRSHELADLNEVLRRSIERERQAAEESLALAGTLQRRLLTPPRSWPGVEVAVRYRPALRAAQLGGDWFDTVRARDGRRLVVVGDVCGHDVEAVAAMGQLRHLLRGAAHAHEGSPAELVTVLDEALADLGTGTLATTLVAELREAGHPQDDGAPGSAVLRWSSAGHLPPVVVSEGSARLLQRPADLLLGLDPAAARHDHEVPLEPGATVLLYTDGLVERRGEHLDTGTQRLLRAAEAVADADLETVCDALLATSDPDGEDDVALLALRRTARAPDGAPGGAPAA